MKRKLEFHIDESYRGLELLHYMKNILNLSSALIRKIKKFDDGICIDNKRVFTNYKINGGEHLTLTIENDESFSKNIVPKEGSLDILYEDLDILVINKAPKLPVHPSKGHFDDSLANFVSSYYKSKGENFTFRCVNRLDSDSSGVIIIAKNAHSHARLAEQFKTEQFKRIYTAICIGIVFPETDLIEKNIRRIPGQATIKREVCDSDSGETAITQYSASEYLDGLTVLKIELKTGRTHQIRVHFSSIGHPLAGDWLYGNEFDGYMERQALHSSEVRLVQPVTGESMHFVAALPEDMKNLIKTYKLK